MFDYPARPQTPQPMLHRLPDKSENTPESPTFSRYILILSASTAAAGKVQIARSVADAFSCPLYQGDSLHETCAKAASVVPQTAASDVTPGRNEARYQRMWLSKMTRTGLLFPEASQPATQGFSGFGGPVSASSSRRGSDSSIASASSSLDSASVASSAASSFMSPVATSAQYINKPTTIPSQRQKDNNLLLVVTHPELDSWHKECIATSVGDYGIGVIFVPLYEDDNLPVLKPLDPRSMTSFDQLPQVGGVAESAITLRIEIDGKVEDIIEQIVSGVADSALVISS
ncbi:hypothetical protein F5X68DRAFT_212489 [Plectosphaerella plurivora]|uniref:Uncharacterized protein n=1 Tax=Plectosphaerella plurivora TaxID=936078 RepID=A0A9P8V7I7_9PEZI|nr:hypothetical protein F5X68DRAFT_212489 [Plectosphaerella plurivora]